MPWAIGRRAGVTGHCQSPPPPCPPPTLRNSVSGLFCPTTPSTGPPFLLSAPTDSPPSASTMANLLVLLASRPAALAAVCAAAVVTALLHSGRPSPTSRHNPLLAWLASRLVAHLPQQPDGAAGRSSGGSSSRRSSRRSSLDGASEAGGDLGTPRLPTEQLHWRVTRPGELGAGGGASGSGWHSGGAAAAPAPAGDPSDDMIQLEALYAYSKLSS